MWCPRRLAARLVSCGLLIAVALGMTAVPALSAVIRYNLDANNSAPTEPEEATTYVFTNLRTQDTSVPSNSSTDLANGLTPVIITGTQHGVSGPITELTDGFGASSDGDTANNFFFNNGDNPGRFRISLPAIAVIGQINTYSWHRFTPIPGLRAPQKYEVYASDGTAGGFLINDETSPGWSLIASVNTVAQYGALDGQYGVSIQSGSGDPLGAYRHFIFTSHPPTDPNNNTFFSEIDILAVPEPTTAVLLATGLLGLVIVGWRRRQSARA